MFKKLFFVGAAAVLLLGLFFGRDAASYVTTSYAKVHDSVKSNVPIDFEIQRARRMIKNLTPEIRRNLHVIATEEVKVERLRKKIDQLENRQDTDRDGLMKLKASLESGNGSIYLAGHSYTAKQVKADMANRFERFKTNDGTLLNLHKVLGAREKGLDAAKAKLEGMLASKRQLEVDVENLEARLKMVEVAQTSSDFNFDDSHLARTKGLVTDIQTRLDVAERMVNAETDFHYEIPLDEPETEDVTEQITEYFGGDRPAIENVADVLK